MQVAHQPRIASKSPAPTPRKATDFLDNAQETWLQKPQTDARRGALGLGAGARDALFAEQCEFVSLGGYCAASRALQALDLKKYSYPFDWTRSPASGVIQCLEQGFRPFFTYSFEADKGICGHLLGGSDWGGSFWHHDIRSPEVRNDFARRIDRLFGRREVPSTTPRVFVRSVNSSGELYLTQALFGALRRALPGAPIYLVLLVDNQSEIGPLRVAGPDSDKILICRIHENLYAANGTNWSMEKQCEAYSEAVAFAIRFWAGNPGAVTSVEECPSMQHLMAMIAPFEGGDASRELFFARRVASHSMPHTMMSGQMHGSPVASGYLTPDRRRQMMPELSYPPSPVSAVHTPPHAQECVSTPRAMGSMQSVPYVSPSAQECMPPARPVGSLQAMPYPFPNPPQECLSAVRPLGSTNLGQTLIAPSRAWCAPEHTLYNQPSLDVSWAGRHTPVRGQGTFLSPRAFVEAIH